MASDDDDNVPLSPCDWNIPGEESDTSDTDAIISPVKRSRDSQIDDHDDASSPSPRQRQRDDVLDVFQPHVLCMAMSAEEILDALRLNEHLKIQNEDLFTRLEEAKMIVDKYEREEHDVVWFLKLCMDAYRRKLSTLELPDLPFFEILHTYEEARRCCLHPHRMDTLVCSILLQIARNSRS